MPEFWEYPTVSMGLGPINAIGQAHVARYLQARGTADTASSRVWCFVGDGELDEPETLGSLGMAGREHLDNLTFVVNCNLQRLDGPVRGNGKVIQEFEALFRGAGWNVIKVIWGRTWDELLAKDVEGVLLNKMNTTVDGEFQKYATESGAYIREHFFGPDPRLSALVAHLSDEELQSLPRGGHDYRKLYAAYRAATEHRGAPDRDSGQDGEGVDPRSRDRSPERHPPDQEDDQAPAAGPARSALPARRDPRTRPRGRAPPYYRPEPGSPAAKYLADRRQALAGPLPRRTVRARALDPPAPGAFADLLAGSGRQAVSTTMALARLLRSLVRDPSVGPRIVPIVSDEARTFGLESLISEAQIYAPGGPALHPGRRRAGPPLRRERHRAGPPGGHHRGGRGGHLHRRRHLLCHLGRALVPFYLFYSMFGFQRVGDLLWALGDSRGRGFLLGCTAGRTTLNGEGLQHQDGHSLLLASTVPSVAAYDPAFAYELAVIVEDGIRRMTGPDAEDRVWYLTLYNENYPMPALARGRRRRGTGPDRHGQGPLPIRRPRPGRGRPSGRDGLHPVLRARLAGGRRGPAAAGHRLGRRGRPPGRPPRTRRSGRTPCRPSGGTASIPSGPRAPPT